MNKTAVVDPSTGTERIVYGGGNMGYKWRATIILGHSTWRGRPGYRYVIDKHFMGWDKYQVSKWYSDYDAAYEAAQQYLDDKEPMR